MRLNSGFWKYGSAATGAT